MGLMQRSFSTTNFDVNWHANLNKNNKVLWGILKEKQKAKYKKTVGKYSIEYYINTCDYNI